LYVTLQDSHELDSTQLRVLANPLRQEILGLLCREPLSATRLTGRLRSAPSNLHYHLDRLREAGLVELVEERPVRGATEKIYRAVASNFSVAPDALAVPATSGTEHPVLSVIRGHTEWVVGELGHALGQPDQQPPLTSHQRVMLTPSAAKRLRARLREWLEDCRRADRETDADGHLEEWVLLTTFFSRAKGDSFGREPESRTGE
jgi:DNA-binding transcriptional ArsR family regulator